MSRKCRHALTHLRHHRGNLRIVRALAHVDLFLPTLTHAFLIDGRRATAGLFAGYLCFLSEFPIGEGDCCQ